MKAADLAVALVPLLSAAGGLTAVENEPQKGVFSSSASESGADIRFRSLNELRGWASEAVIATNSDKPKYDYTSVSPCSTGPGSPGADALCLRAFNLCLSRPGDGPAVAIYRREVDADAGPVEGAAGAWQAVGYTCFPEAVPGAENVLTMAMIREAFHDTDFSVPTVNVQPEGDVTLVNLPTFFEVVFPREGFGPGEVDRPDPARLMGHAVEVRPKVKTVTYSLGETVVGPTRDLGGPYPDGSVVHSYGSAGEQVVRVDVVYTGQFRVGGSGWIDIPGEVDLEGAPVTLTVREARSRLYTR
ncbi:hypothetical protein JQN72_07835 [Phycicoccus sp. CSK15P-2]|uniref:hypothetical protein n=1 Tax=Phycicoccus sp. CSK15P-2 TaxID=2807627 RepID=UPI00195257E1|nr:hypothetical protein [Phycicoccus sp. CSK15P-2]MBM6404153.1 hypothetical protein [Phycicoccus sp. CSK15P-2]